MGEETVEIEQEVVETQTEKIRIALCDLCGREIKTGGRRYFGVQLDEIHTKDIFEMENARFDEEILTTNTFICCQECNKRLK